MTTPDHELLKREITAKFEPTSTYLGSFVRQIIQQSDFKNGLNAKVQHPPTKIKKGDVLIAFEGVKSRPCVVVKVLKDKTVLYIPLTSTENVHCLSSFTSRFFGEGCFSKSFSVCTEEFAIQNFVGVFDNMKSLNVAIKKLKEFIAVNV